MFTVPWQKKNKKKKSQAFQPRDFRGVRRKGWVFHKSTIKCFQQKDKHVALRFCLERREQLEQCDVCRL